MGLRIGLLARGDTGGLAAQTEDFYRWMKPYKTLLIDYDVYTGYHTDYTKYPDAMTVDREPSDDVLKQFLTGLDLVFTVETPYSPSLFSIARQMGVKSVLQYNYEWLQQHQDDVPLPDLFLAPSEWNRDKMKWPTKYLHVPVDREKFPFKAKREAQKFLHIAGHKTMGDRNGTAILLEALPYIQSQVEIVIRTQDDLPRPYTDSKLTIIKEDVSDRRDLYNDEDVLILPRKYGGLSLQLNEALSLGMPVIMPDIAPQNEFLPQWWLVKAMMKETTMIKTPVEVYECTPQDLAAKIDEFAQDMGPTSYSADSTAKERDWKVMKPQYEDLFEELCHSQ